MYARLINGEWQPYGLADLIEDNGGPANFSPPSPFDEAAAANHGMARIDNGERPDDTLTRRTVFMGLADVDGVPVRQWALEPLPLEQAKAALWDKCKSIRDEHVDGGASVPGIGVFDSDPMSRSNINGATTGAVVAQSLGQPFSVGWKLADNSVVALDGSQMIASGMAVLQHVAACHAVAQAKGLAIIAASDVDDLEAIDLGAGWP